VTQQLSFNNQTRSSNSNGLAVAFFLLGAPHIYSSLRKQANKKANFWLSKYFGWFIAVLAGALMLVAA